MDSSGWAVTDSSMSTSTDDGFQQFLDMNTMDNLGQALDYHFHGFQQPAGSHILQPHSANQLDVSMTGTDTPILLSPAVSSMQQQMPSMTTSAPFQALPAAMMPPPTPSEALMNSLDAQIQFLQQQKMQHQQRQLEEQQTAFFARNTGSIVPPTPQSLELQPGTGQFYGTPSHNAEQRQKQQRQQQHQQHHSADYGYQRISEQSDMSFTPLVSPAVTPLDTQFSTESAFAASAAYFSPLTSPALHSQNDSLSIFEPLRGPTSSSSPVEMDLGPAAESSIPSATPADLTKKLRKSVAKARVRSGVKQSPISKPQRRRTATTPSLNAQALSELIETAEANQDSQLLPTPMIQTSSSSTTTGPTDTEDSVSPEPLSDSAPAVEMPPPPIPKPRSAKPSPFIAPQIGAGTNASRQASRAPGLASPATPASLMKLSSPSTRVVGASRPGSQEAVETEHMEALELPESINTLSEGANCPTPTQPAREKASSKTPYLAPLPSPSITKPSTITATVAPAKSPQLLPGSSSADPSATSKKTPQLLPRNAGISSSKKRGSVSSVPISPALLPKISPNIKPLLPGGPEMEEAASQLLASKSNYQRILEGSTLPGVSFPSELSANLTSKRTSHKIAEQGRRNRINSALQEIASLLPQRQQAPPTKDSSGGEDGGDAGSEGKKEGKGVPISKASTVEMAIEYIKQLQREVAAANKRAEEAERKLEAVAKAGREMGENGGEEKKGEEKEMEMREVGEQEKKVEEVKMTE